MESGKCAKQTKKWFLFAILACLLVLVCLPMTCQAASQKTEAMKAYKKFLSQSKILCNPLLTYQQSNIRFALIYIDNNAVPELLVSDMEDGNGFVGYGMLYTFQSGKIKQIASLNGVPTDAFRYYRKKGIFTDNYMNMGLDTTMYTKLSKGKAVRQCASFYSSFKNKTEYIKYSGTNGAKVTTISKTNFNSNLKKLVKSTKKIKPNFYTNTKSNRAKYCK